jgi:hypothetical protein
MSKVQLITQSEYAKHRGVSEAAVSKAVREGRISLIDKRIDPNVADVQWAANSRARAPSSQAGTAGPGARPAAVSKVAGVASAPSGGHDGVDMPDQPGDYWQSRARREAAEAELAELKLAELRGLVLRREAVESATFNASRAMRDGLVNCSRRLAADVATLSTPHECEQIIAREHRMLLDTWNRSMAEQIRIAPDPEAAAP